MFPTNVNMIPRTTDQLHVRAARPEDTLLPPPLPIGYSTAKPASRPKNDDVKNTFRILVIVLLIMAVIAIVMIRIVKQGRKKKKGAARAAEMEMAIQAAIQQQASHSCEEQLPSYAEAIAAGSQIIKSCEERRPVIVNNQEDRRVISSPDPADLGNGVRPGVIFQPANNRLGQVEGGTAGRPIIIND